MIVSGIAFFCRRERFEGRGTLKHISLFEVTFNRFVFCCCFYRGFLILCLFLESCSGIYDGDGLHIGWLIGQGISIIEELANIAESSVEYKT